MRLNVESRTSFSGRGAAGLKFWGDSRNRPNCTANLRFGIISMMVKRLGQQIANSCHRA